MKRDLWQQQNLVLLGLLVARIVSYYVDQVFATTEGDKVKLSERWSCKLSHCSVERILAYTNEYEAEKPAIIPHKRPPQEWPSKGQITLDNLVVTYRPDLPPVLKGLSLKIKGGEKVAFMIAYVVIAYEDQEMSAATLYIIS